MKCFPSSTRKITFIFLRMVCPVLEVMTSLSVITTEAAGIPQSTCPVRSIRPEDDIAFNSDPSVDTVAFYTTRKNRNDPSPLLLKVTIDKKNTPPELTALSDILYNMAMVHHGLMAETVKPEPAKPIEKEALPENKTTTAAIDTIQQRHEEIIPPENVVNQELKTEAKAAPPSGTFQVKLSLAEKFQRQQQEVATGTIVRDSVEMQGLSIKIREAERGKDNVTYRVQFASSRKSKKPYTVTVSGKKYRTWQYYYKGAYRQCIGNFDSLGPAKKLQDDSRKQGFPQAFVVVFVNGKRTVDPKYFR